MKKVSYDFKSRELIFTMTYEQIRYIQIFNGQDYNFEISQIMERIRYR